LDFEGGLSFLLELVAIFSASFSSGADDKETLGDFLCFFACFLSFSSFLVCSRRQKEQPRRGSSLKGSTSWTSSELQEKSM
jgi:hypothetical protein